MSELTITLPDNCYLKLVETAAGLGLTPEELVRVSIEEWLTQPDDTFEEIIDYILHKNAELYRRLAQ